MNETIRFLAQYDYWLLLGAILGRQACLPIPANLVLVAAGALARAERLTPAGIVGLSVAAFLCADVAWYGAGRKFGGKILHFACGLTRDSVSCAHKATSAFDKYGVRVLLVSKFIPGFDAVAAPLAGQAHVSVIRFLVFDALGAAFWTGTYAALGYVFANQLDLVALHLARVGTIVAVAIGAGLSFYSLRRVAHWPRFLRQFRLARITPEELRDQLNAGKDILLVDLQRPADGSSEGIPGAVRINPQVLEKCKDLDLSPSREVVLYCTCPSEFTSARVALALQRNGIACVRPLAGGLRAWRERGFPVTAEVRGLARPTAVRA